MSILQNPITGRMRQKLGGVVFTTWKGINVMRGKPLTVANPRTDAQLMRRSALSQMTEIARLISDVINLGFKEQAVRKSAFNAFVGNGLRNAFDYSAPPTATFVPEDLATSQGTISPTTWGSMALSAGGNDFQMDWDATNLMPGQSNADVPIIALRNNTTGLWVPITQGVATRADETVTVTFPAGSVSVGNTCQFYFFFYNATNRKSSDSVTSTVIAGA